uniref:COG3536: Uncharacterized protein conserved in bacteria n=1 Tax=uncultured Thiotrichaceae bacterium TaxID=298394 RepID=A0A6S6S6D6_9GAMM|nr:MAG: COG3536: Uncharacterized protein conserved in bacteria [uncultured Thiotrichaceae bacterium]
MAAPTDITLNQKSRELTISWPNDVTYVMSCEYLRVSSPSAEVRGHGPGQETLQIGKENVNITDIEPVGHYAVKLVFDDGHDSGLYDWNLLYDLGENQEQYWAEYLEKLTASGYVRKAEGQVI